MAAPPRPRGSRHARGRRLWRVHDGVAVRGGALGERGRRGEPRWRIGRAGGERRRLHRPGGHHQLFDLGRPAGDQGQQAIVDAFHEANPKITVKVTVSDWEPYWDKLQTSIAGGDAPDVFAMDGPLFPDYQTRDVLLDLKPFIDRDGYDLGQLADQAVADFTTPDGQFGLPRDLNVVALYYNKAMFDAAGIPYPDDTWDWAKLTDVAKQLTLRDASGKTTQWGFYTESTDMENFWSEARLAERRRHHLGRPQDEPRRERPGGGRDPVPAGPDLEGQGHARRGHHRRARRRLRAGPGGDGVERLVARRDPPGRRARLRDRPVAEGPGRAGDLDQPDRRGRLQGDEEPRRRLGVRQVPREPGRPDQDHGAEGVAAGQQGGPPADRSRRPSTAPRSSSMPSTTPTSSPRSRATTSGRPRSRRSSTPTSSPIRTRRPSRP